MIKKIGFIGLGIMGKPMAINLLHAGYKLNVYDLLPSRYEGLDEIGSHVSNSIQEACTGVDLIITMLPDSPDVENAYLGKLGILEHVKPGTILVDMSTIAPRVSMKLAEAAIKKHCNMLDAPVSGGDVGAQKGTLSIMVGGEEDIFLVVKPVFNVMGKSTLCGKHGSGQIVKACNQILVAVTLLGMSEALVLGTKAGVDPTIIVNVLNGGLARCGVLENRGLRVIQRDFEPGFKSKLHYKDLNIIQATAREYDTPLPAVALAHELFSTMLSKGRGDLDHSGIITVIEDLAHIQVKKIK